MTKETTTTKGGGVKLEDKLGTVELDVQAGKPVVVLKCSCKEVSVEVDLSIQKAERLVTGLAEAIFHAKKQVSP